jgi:hypothetical protein
VHCSSDSLHCLVRKVFQEEFDHLAVELRLAIAAVLARVTQHALDAQFVHALLQQVP